MNRQEFVKILIDNKNLIDESIDGYFKGAYTLAEALNYSIDSGKRIRANLFFETLGLFSYDIGQNEIDFALGLEMIHAYSLVHDDLPAMDDDDLRRGKATVHKEFGEDLAILTGDALLNEASSILLNLASKDKKYASAGKYVFDHTGFKGMVDGQVLDLRAPKGYSKDYLLEVYEKKTSDLFKASMVGAAIISKASDEEIKNLEDYAYKLGLAYQIQDDLLEDTYENELNILNVLPKTYAIKLLADINNSAKKSISKFTNNDFLLYLVDYLSEREN